MNNLLITGGTGSLGHAIVDNLLKNSVLNFYDKITILSRDEQKQEQMYIHFRDKDRRSQLRYLIGDVRDKQRLSMAIKNNVTDIIHCAALKIVPAMEYNPFEAVKTNILGSQNLIECCVENYNQVRTLLAVSTDKAVLPINLYGSTKLAMEKLVLAANNIYNEKGTRYAVVRYGNVAGSRGSVIPYFRKLQAQGLPFTITHKDMTRFWITLEEAAAFVIDSHDQMVTCGIRNHVFIPDMKAFRIKDLAQAMGEGIYDTKINYIGIRPGEKLHEVIAIGDSGGRMISSDRAIKMSQRAIKIQLNKLGL